MKKSKVRAYYTMGLWNKARVRKAVECGWIDREFYLTLTGEAYE